LTVTVSLAVLAAVEMRLLVLHLEALELQDREITAALVAAVKAEALPAIPAIDSVAVITIEYSAPGEPGGGEGGGGDGGGGEGPSIICDDTETLPIEMAATPRSVDSCVVLPPTTDRGPKYDVAVWAAGRDGITIDAWTMPPALM
jgi:hypothetical protein